MLNTGRGLYGACNRVGWLVLAAGSSSIKSNPGGFGDMSRMVVVVVEAEVVVTGNEAPGAGSSSNPGISKESDIAVEDPGWGPRLDGTGKGDEAWAERGGVGVAAAELAWRARRGSRTFLGSRVIA
jgi:hypothetical protein